MLDAISKNLCLRDFSRSVVRVRDFLIGDRDHRPHQHRHPDGMSSDFCRGVFSLRETPGYRSRCAGQYWARCAKRRSTHAASASPLRWTAGPKVRPTTITIRPRDFFKTPCLHNRSAPWREGRQLLREREPGHVEDSFHRPDGNLRRKRQTLAPRNEVRTDQFPGAPQKREPGKSDDCGRDQSDR